MRSPASSERPPLAQLLEAGRLDVACFTDEELIAVGADRAAPFQLSPAPDRVSSQPEEFREPILATALRSLIARGVVQPPTEEQLSAPGPDARVELDTRGELQVVLSIRNEPSVVAFVGQAEYFAMLHGLQPDEAEGYLEERVNPQGLHYFTLWSADQMVESLAARMDPQGLTVESNLRPQAPQGEPPLAVTQAMLALAPGVTRIDAYHQRPAGNRRLRFGVLVTPEATWVATSAFGVDPQSERTFLVDRAGLRARIRGVLTDSEPGAAPGG